jgi:hypothetical protein
MTRSLRACRLCDRTTQNASIVAVETTAAMRTTPGVEGADDRLEHGPAWRPDSPCANLRTRVAEAKELACTFNDDIEGTVAVVLADLDYGAQTARSLFHFTIGIASGCRSRGSTPRPPQEVERSGQPRPRQAHP